MPVDTIIRVFWYFNDIFKCAGKFQKFALNESVGSYGIYIVVA